MIKYEDVKNQTTDQHFNNNQFSIDAFNKKYALYEGETYCQALKRVCDFIASVEETDELKKYWSERWFDEIYSSWWHPAGSIMQGANSGKNISLANCSTTSLGCNDEDNQWDNLESIIRNAAYTVAKTAAYRQGQGIDYSKLRPVGMKVENSANESTGSLHWMQFIDSIAYYVGQKGRRPALLFSLSINHPDVIDFIQIKKDYTKIQNANISVQITDKFYKAVENDDEWEMKFIIPGVKKGDKIYLDVHSKLMDAEKDEKGWFTLAQKNRKREIISKKEKARKILELIAKNMYENAEPGIQNIDIARKYSNSDAVYDEKCEYDSKILSTNACSEQFLSRDSLCVLSSINVEKFSIIQTEYKQELSIIGESINRFLDNVNECELQYNTYATPHQKLAIKYLRRTGAGLTNIGGFLFKANLEYGSLEGNSLVADFMNWYNYHLYKSSINLGKEKGSFELFDKEKIKKSQFIKNLLKDHSDLEFTHLRNVTCSSIAPTGTLSLMFRELGMGYGIEPSFGLAYFKRTRISGKYEYYFNVPHIVRDTFEKAGYKIPIESDTIKDTWDGKYGRSIIEFINAHKDLVGVKFKDADQISPFDKLNLMGQVMRYVDSSISVTYMLPENTEWKDVYSFILKAHEKEVKSIAAFPNKKMYGIISYTPFKDLAIKLKKEGVSIHFQNFDQNELKELDINQKDIKPSSNAPKRPTKLTADIYGITVKGEKFCIVVGLLNGVPYEIFGGKMNDLGFKFIHKSGFLEKIKQNQYSLEIGEDIVIEDFGKHFTPTEQILFRLTSTSLRHGVPLKFIVEQLSKASQDMLSFSSAAARVLKKYIKDGDKVTGMSCGSCGSKELSYLDGCATCTNCSWSKCN